MSRSIGIARGTQAAAVLLAASGHTRHPLNSFRSLGRSRLAQDDRCSFRLEAPPAHGGQAGAHAAGMAPRRSAGAGGCSPYGLRANAARANAAPVGGGVRGNPIFRRPARPGLTKLHHPLATSLRAHSAARGVSMDGCSCEPRPRGSGQGNPVRPQRDPLPRGRGSRWD